MGTGWGQGHDLQFTLLPSPVDHDKHAPSGGMHLNHNVWEGALRALSHVHDNKECGLLKGESKPRGGGEKGCPHPFQGVSRCYKSRYLCNNGHMTYDVYLCHHLSIRLSCVWVAGWGHTVPTPY